MHIFLLLTVRHNRSAKGLIAARIVAISIVDLGEKSARGIVCLEYEEKALETYTLSVHVLIMEPRGAFHY